MGAMGEVGVTVQDGSRADILARRGELPELRLTREQATDARNIGRGVYAPLTGFLSEADVQSVVASMQLTSGAVWPIPVVLDVDGAEADALGASRDVFLLDTEDQPVALLSGARAFAWDREAVAEGVFGTTDRAHPGVADLYRMGDYLVGGRVTLLDDAREPLPDYNRSPAETRELFARKGWDTVVAFQTRNVPHRGHEFLQREALKVADGLFVQPVIGKKKPGDFRDEYIMICYEMLLRQYYPADTVVLGILPLKMRYAGPREAVFHALIRKNYGCTHFIVGRDHAGVGDYYQPYAAQEIFETLPRDIGIDILKYGEVVYCTSKKTHTFLGDCPVNDRLSFSGTQLRGAIEAGRVPEDHLMRPEIGHFLTHCRHPFVAEDGRAAHPGFVLWFTGLSQAGKTTTADRVREELAAQGLHLERLDGDIVRKSVSKELGFTKEDRDENIRRVRQAARLLSQGGIGVIASFISPYRAVRARIREQVTNFIEVYCNAPLEVCEHRDQKGLYAKARQGVIDHFTGISDPYEAPEEAEIVLHTDTETVEECVAQVVAYVLDFLDTWRDAQV